MTYLYSFSYQCDVADREQVESVSKAILSEVGDVTILINNAGRRVVRPFFQQNVEEIKTTIDVNLYGECVLWHSTRM